MKNDIIQQLYTKYYNSLMVIAVSYTHDKKTAEDLVQETFLRAMLSYSEGGSFLYWCNRVMRNLFYSELKRDSRKADIAVSELEIDSGMNILSDYIANEEKERLAAMISNLPVRYREVMICSVYLEMPDDKIAESMAISKENVRQLRSRATKMLKEMNAAHETD